MSKPLISHAQLRSIHALAQHLTAEKRTLATRHDLGRTQRTAITRYPVALLAATLFQLRPGDALVTQYTNPLLGPALAFAAPVSRPGTRSVQVHTTDQSAPATALLAAGLALHQRSIARALGERSITLAILDEDGDLSECLQLAYEHLLPMVLLQRCDLAAAATRSRRPLVPSIPVDDTDAVAVCRVLQESLIRARHGWSSVLIQAVHPPAPVDPVVLLQQHLKRRQIEPSTSLVPSTV